MTRHPAVPAPMEVEAKLAVSNDSDLRAIAKLDRIGAYGLRHRGLARLHSVYFDTADLVLARHRIALRARRCERRWEITLKWQGEVLGAVHARPELTESLPHPPDFVSLKLPPTFETQVSAFVAGRPLKPILITDVHRNLLDAFETGNGSRNDSLAELALDRVRLRAPDGGEPVAMYCEIEVEKKGGSHQDVDQVARLLQQQFELAPSPESKFSHGITVLYGPQLAEFDPPLADGSVYRAAQRLVGQHLLRLRANDPGTRLGENREALHDMRVASRRLRAVLRFFGGPSPRQRSERLREDLRWLNSLLSPVRDCDVQLETLQRYEELLTASRRPALGPYREYIKHERDEHRKALLTALRSRRYFTLLLKLDSFAHDRRPPRLKAGSAPAAEMGWRATKHAFKRLLRQGESVSSTPTPEELHRIRIRAKRLRYLLEFFRDSSGKPGRRLLKYLVRLQDLLGAHNDAIGAANFLDRFVNGPGADTRAASLLILSGLLQEELRRARKTRAQFHQTWRRFDAKRTKNDWRAVHRLLRKEARVVAARSAKPAPTQSKEAQ